MVALFVKFKIPNPQKWINWNDSTFELRQSLGLIAVAAFNDSTDKQNYISISFWHDSESLKRYLADPNIQQMMDSPDIEWTMEMKAVEEAFKGFITLGHPPRAK